MNNQFSGNKNPPWARQDYGNQGVAGIMQPNVAYPYNQGQTQFAQQQIGPPANLQAAPGALLSQPGLPMQPSLAGNNAQVGAVSYPIKPPGNAAAVPNQKQRTFTGNVTKMHENFGFVDEEVFFQVSCVKGMLPKVGDKVLVEASYNANMPFKWNATRVVPLHDALSGNQMMAMQQQHQQQHQQQQQQQLKAIQQQAIGLMAVPGLMGGMGNLPSNQGPPPLMPGMGKFQSGGMFNSGNRSGINTGPGLLGDPMPRNLMSNKDQRGMTVGSMSSGETQKERDRRERERRERRDTRRKRSRSPVKRSRSPPKRSRSPPPRARSPRSPPPKRRVPRPPPRYVVQVPKILLDAQDTCVVSLKNKYTNLYIPSDFFHASFSWVENFPLTRPFTLGQACNFHVMHKDVPPIKPVTAVLDPGDTDHLFSAKVMLLASPSEEELYKKSCCFAEDLPDAFENFQHPTRLLQFLVGTRGKNEPMAIGGPWSPSLDGPNPHTNPLVLIKTAIRTTKALTGIDLSSCTQWYRFAEIRYFRPESKHKDRVQPARVETVVLFLPDVWTCNPTRLEWNSLQAAYQKQLQQTLNPDTAQQQEEEESEMQGIDDKAEPSHYSTLDPKVMKVGELRKELELRNITPKGLKSQMVARLAKALKMEQEKEQEGKEIEAEKAAEEEASKLEEENEDEDEEKNDIKKKEDEEQLRKEKREKAILERRYKLPEIPSVLVHPSPTAKSGKFDCSVMSLSLLLDYRPEDNKEHSFEVSLFAELFNEMLMRDFGFQIYKSIACATPLKEEEKKKEDKKDKEEKDKKEEKKSSKDRSDDDRDDRRDDDASDEDEDRDDDDRRERDDKKKKKDEEKKMKTVDPGLLLAFSYFDQNHCGYLTDKDTEDIIHTLGLKLSRAQIKKLLQKIVQKESFKYRQLTDAEVDDNGVVIFKMDESENNPTNKPDSELLARGNKESLRKLLELSGTKTEPTGQGAASSTVSDADNPNFVYYKGALVDIESLMQRLDRSEKSRTALEKNLQGLTGELETVKSNLVEEGNTTTKLQHDLRKVRSDLDKERSLYSASDSLNREWHKTAVESRSYMMTALNSLNTLLNKEDKGKSEEHRSKGDDYKSKSDEHKRKEIKKQTEDKEIKVETMEN